MEEEDEGSRRAVDLSTEGFDIPEIRGPIGVQDSGTPDQVIARSASLLGAVVVTWNKRHFENLAKRKLKSGSLSFPGMSVITFTCVHPHGLPRLQVLIEQIEAVYRLRVESGGVRMIADVGDMVLRFED